MCRYIISLKIPLIRCPPTLLHDRRGKMFFKPDFFFLPNHSVSRLNWICSHDGWVAELLRLTHAYPNDTVRFLVCSRVQRNVSEPPLLVTGGHRQSRVKLSELRFVRSEFVQLILFTLRITVLSLEHPSVSVLTEASCCVQTSYCFKYRDFDAPIENENTVNLKIASFIIIMLEGLTHIHSQKNPRLHFVLYDVKQQSEASSQPSQLLWQAIPPKTFWRVISSSQNTYAGHNNNNKKPLL